MDPNGETAHFHRDCWKPARPPILPWCGVRFGISRTSGFYASLDVRELSVRSAGHQREQDAVPPRLTMEVVEASRCTIRRDYVESWRQPPGSPQGGGSGGLSN
jgi:hypothetical protein